MCEISRPGFLSSENVNYPLLRHIFLNFIHMWTGFCGTPSVFKVLTNIWLHYFLLETSAIIVKSHIIGTFVNLLTSVGYKIFVNCPRKLWLLCLLASSSSVWRLSRIATCFSALWRRKETRLKVSCHRGGSPGSILGHSFWYLWWKKWQWDRFLFKYLGVSLSVWFHQRTVLHVPSTVDAVHLRNKQRH